MENYLLGDISLVKVHSNPSSWLGYGPLGTQWPMILQIFGG